MANILTWKGPDYIVTNMAYAGSPNHYIHFQHCQGLHPESLEILVQDTSYAGWKSLGPLRSSVKLPFVVFPPHARLVVQGRNVRNEPISFVGSLTRGGTYILHTSNRGNHSLDAHISLHNGGSCCPYSGSN